MTDTQICYYRSCLIPSHTAVPKTTAPTASIHLLCCTMRTTTTTLVIRCDRLISVNRSAIPHSLR